MELQNYILKNKFLKIVTFFVILLYLFVPVYLASHVANMNHAMHMNHTINTECIYNIGENGLCGMDLFNTLFSWKNNSNLFLPFILLICIAILFNFFCFFFKENIFKTKTIFIF